MKIKSILRNNYAISLVLFLVFSNFNILAAKIPNAKILVFNAKNGGEWANSWTLLPNAAPTDIALSLTAINENSAGNSIVGTLTSTDNDGQTNTFQYTLVPGIANNSAFSIDGANLRINTSPDYELKSSYSIRIRSTDQGGLSFDKDFTITINNQNDAPRISGIDNIPICLNRSKTINFIVSDIENDVINLSVSISNSTLLADTSIVINTVSGAPGNRTLTIKPINGKSGVSTVTVLANDGTNSTTRSFKVLVPGSSANEVVSTFAGNGNAAYSGDGGPANQASFSSVLGLTKDVFGNIYITDNGNHRIRKIAASTGIVTTVAGTGVAGFSGDKGPATQAQVKSPFGITTDAAGNIYFTESFGSYRIRRINIATGIIETIAGTGVQGFSGDGGQAINATFGDLNGLVIDPTGTNLYVADLTNHRIRKINLTTGIVTTVAGTGTSGYSGDGGAATLATITHPTRVAFSSTGEFYFIDGGGGKVRKIDANGMITTVLGNSNSSAKFNEVAGTNTVLFRSIFLDAVDNLYVGDEEVIYKINLSDNKIYHVSGKPNVFTHGGDNGPIKDATYAGIYDMLPDGLNAIYVLDRTSNRIRKFPFTYSLDCNLAPTAISLSSSSINENTAIGSTIGTLSSADNDGVNNTFTYSLVTGTTANDNSLFSITGSNLVINFSPNFEQKSSYAIRVRTTDQGGLTFEKDFTILINNINEAPVITILNTAICPNSIATINFTISDDDNNEVTLNASSNSTNLIPTAGMTINTPTGTPGPRVLSLSPVNNQTGTANLVITANDGLITTTRNFVVYVTAQTINGIASTVIGNGSATYFGDGGQATQAGIANVGDVVMDAAGNYYISDYGAFRIRKVNATTGIITTIAGTGLQGTTGDGGPATAAKFLTPMGLAVDESGNLYIADQAGNTIRKINAATGIISTIAGTGIGGFAGDGGQATSAKIDQPIGLLLDGKGNLYCTDGSNYRIRKINLSTGIITTVAGTGSQGNTGDGGQATAASLYFPYGLALDSAGNLYCSATGNTNNGSNTFIRKINTTTGVISTIAGAPNLAVNTGDGGPALGAGLDQARDMGFDSFGDLYITTRRVVRKVSMATGKISTFSGKANTNSHSGDGGPVSNATFAELYGMHIDALNNVYVSDVNSARVRKLTPTYISYCNLPPADITISAQSCNENLPEGTAVAVLGTTEVDELSNTTTYSLVSNGTPNDNAAFTISGSNLTVNTRLNFETKSNLKIRIRATDQGGLSFEKDFTFTVNNVNDAPAISYIPNVITCINTGVSVDFTVSDDDNSSLTITATSPSGSLIADGGLVVNMPNGPQGPRKLAITPRQNTSGGYVTVTISVSDGTLTTKRTFDFFVSTRTVDQGTYRIAGTGTAGNSGDGGTATNATIKNVQAIAMDIHGHMYVADIDENRIRKITGAFGGSISTLIGNGTPGFSGDGSYVPAGQVDNPTAIAAGQNNILYIADANNNRIRMVNFDGKLSTIVGTGVAGYSGDGNLAKNAQINKPSALAADASNNIYIADATYHIRKVNMLNGIITTIAGTGSAGTSGDGGQAIAASIGEVNGLATDLYGNLYISCINDHRIRKINLATGIITTVVGNGSNANTGDGGLAVNASIGAPRGISCDDGGNLYITTGKIIRKITAVDGMINTFAGKPNSTAASPDNIPTKDATFLSPHGIVVDSRNYSVVVTDPQGFIVRCLRAYYPLFCNAAPTGMAISTNSIDENVAKGSIVGALTTIDNDGVDNTFTYTLVGGSLSDDNSSFSIDGSNLVMNVSPDFEKKSGYSVRVRTTDQAGLYYETGFVVFVRNVNEPPFGISLTGKSFNENAAIGTNVGTLFALDYDAQSTLTFSLPNREGAEDNAAFEIVGNKLNTKKVFDYEKKYIYSVIIRVSDQNNAFIEKSYTVRVLNINEGPQFRGLVPVYTCNNTETTTTQFLFSHPNSNAQLTLTATCSDQTLIPNENIVFNRNTGLASDVYSFSFKSVLNKVGRCFITLNVTDEFNNQSEHTLAVEVGDGKSNNVVYKESDGTNTVFNDPRGLVFDKKGNMYFAEGGLHRIRRISPNGVVTTIANAAGVSGYADGSLANARFNMPVSLAIDSTGNIIYVSDYLNNRIRKINLSTNSVSTFVGTGATDNTDGTGAAASIYWPGSMAIDKKGNLYVTQFPLGIRKITPNAVVTTLIGNYSPGPGYEDDTTTTARFKATNGIAIDETGNLYVADAVNCNIRKIGTDGMVTTVAGNGVDGGFNGPKDKAQFYNPVGVIVAKSGEIYVADIGNMQIRKILPDGSVSTYHGASYVANLAFDPNGKLYYSGRGNATNFINQAPANPTFVKCNNKPIDITLSNNTIDENTGNNPLIGTFTVEDLDSIGTYSASLPASTADNIYFSINNNKLYYSGNPNYEFRNTLQIYVRATDEFGVFFEKYFTIKINNVNEAPTNVTLSPNAINEGVAAGSTVGNLFGSDPDLGSSFTYNLATGTGDTDNGAFTITENKLTINASPKYSVKNSYAIRVRVQDQFGLTFEKELSVIINSLNAAPTISAINTQNTCKNSPATPITFTVADAENQNITLTATSSNTTLVPHANLVFNTPAGASGSRTLTITPVANQLGTASITLTATDAGNASTSQTFTFTVNDVPVITTEPSNQTASCSSSTASFNLTATGTAITYQWQQKATTASVFTAIATNDNAFSGSTTANLFVSNTNGKNQHQYRCIVAGTCSPSDTSAAVVLTVTGTPVISTQPVNTTACDAAKATFKLVAEGQSLIYKWQRNSGSGFVNLSDDDLYTGTATNELSITTVSAAMNNYSYRCQVSNLCAGLVASTAAVLTVDKTPRITAQPKGLSLCEGSTANFSVTTTGAVKSYQWQTSDDGTTFQNVVNATSNTFQMTSIKEDQNGTFIRCAVDATCPQYNDTTATVLLAIKSPVKIINNPTSVNGCKGKEAVFVVDATGSQVKYQWEKSENAGISFVTIPAETKNTLKVIVDTLIMQYRCKVTDACANTVYSEVATLTANLKTAILTHPLSTTSCRGTEAVFVVTASGTSLTYKWEQSANSGASYTAIAGATNSILLVNKPTSAMNGNLFRAVVTDACGQSYTSNPATLSIPFVATVTQQPKDTGVCALTNVTFATNASDPLALFQWQKSPAAGGSFTDVIGGIGKNLIVFLVTKADSGVKYRCRVISLCGDTVYTNTAQLAVYTPSVTIKTKDVKCFGGNDGEIEAIASGVALPVKYLWSTTRTEQKLIGMRAGFYTVLVTDFRNCITQGVGQIKEPLPLELSLENLLGPTGFPVSGLGSTDGGINTSVIGGTPPFSYLWSNNSTSPNLSGLTTGIYNLTVTDKNGCTATGTSSLTAPGNVQISGGMSPNGDGINDLLQMTGIENYPDNTVEIYNSSKVLVKTIRNCTPSSLWDGGDESGKVVTNGSYIVKVTALTGGKPQVFQRVVEVRRFL